MCIRDRPESEPQSGKEARPSGSVPHDSLWLHIPSVSLSRTTPAKRRQLPSCRRTAGTPTKASDLLVLNREQRPEPSSPQNRSQPHGGQVGVPSTLRLRDQLLHHHVNHSTRRKREGIREGRLNVDHCHRSNYLRHGLYRTGELAVENAA